jgi:hypothetical protein
VIAGARERSAPAKAVVEVSRSGAMPEPTVTVRIKEIAIVSAAACLHGAAVCSRALILVLRYLIGNP